MEKKSGGKSLNFDVILEKTILPKFKSVNFILEA